MTITISSEDPRSLKAVEIAAEAGQWAKCRTRDGRKLYAVPSQQDGVLLVEVVLPGAVQMSHRG